MLGPWPAERPWQPAQRPWRPLPRPWGPAQRPCHQSQNHERPGRPAHRAWQDGWAAIDTALGAAQRPWRPSHRCTCWRLRLGLGKHAGRWWRWRRWRRWRCRGHLSREAAVCAVAVGPTRACFRHDRHLRTIFKGRDLHPPCRLPTRMHQDRAAVRPVKPEVPNRRTTVASTQVLVAMFLGRRGPVMVVGLRPRVQENSDQARAHHKLCLLRLHRKYEGSP